MNQPLLVNRITRAIRWMSLGTALLLSLETGLHAQYTYVTNAGTLTITGYTGPGGVVAIPSIIDGLPVTAIGAGAFASCSNLQSITIPDGVIEIGSLAFWDCIGLTNI